MIGTRIKYSDLTGRQFGKWKVIGFSHLNKYRGHYWKCKCECGTERAVIAQSLYHGKSTSCGCDCSRWRKTTKQSVLEKHLFALLRGGAKQRNLLLELTQDEYIQMTKQPCYYCGAVNSNSNRTKGGVLIPYNGVDRLDSSKGYITGNCVPCCKTCNLAKNTMTEYEFKDWIYRVTIGDWFNE